MGAPAPQTRGGQVTRTRFERLSNTQSSYSSRVSTLSLHEFDDRTHRLRDTLRVDII
jgi:hypothetical protein